MSFNTYIRPKTSLISTPFVNMCIINDDATNIRVMAGLIKLITIQQESDHTLVLSKNKLVWPKSGLALKSNGEKIIKKKINSTVNLFNRFITQQIRHDADPSSSNSTESNSDVPTDNSVVSSNGSEDMWF